MDDFDLERYDYTLPQEAIAQVPVEPRDHSRLMVVKEAGHEHHFFYELPDLLQSGDLLVLNDTRVLPARLLGIRAGGGQAEILLLHERSAQQWECLVRPGRRLLPGSKVTLGGGVQAEILTREAGGTRTVQFHLPPEVPFMDWLQATGTLPLPPYITEPNLDPERYQTLWASTPGAAAAPTAGLHFTHDLLARLKERKIAMAYITLHVGVGTFRPLTATDIREHVMHHEWLTVPEATVDQIQQTRQQGGRVIAVGTTVARALESASAEGSLRPWQGWSGLYIYPGYRWRSVDGLITNFHLPKTSLLILVSTLVGRERLLALYQEATARGYRFYSFGDAMLILGVGRSTDGRADTGLCH
ncbi:tRNA preQ1(34) S-adenosylmethionine ribosyltransferase-isomerase QueA [Anthocerotibacter panamensis]|uniref:tRNA preQ1(34) S-adenosylmethionine ribosyltransferase-isomerase QueA n=1 Tax=Anthocerotibacter panamensis TaxID=2857077 RepID=UPI001C402AFD|nr:tRNA preQ1(34) S-adenosylmethionine ribosyltransferase-isomerase QueA [Anthocerotibacter panamensis]